MSNPPISLNNLESIMRAAEIESESLREPTEPVAQDSFRDPGLASLNGVQTQIIERKEVATSMQEHLPEIPSISNSMDVKEALKNTNISDMLNQMAANPEEVSKMMEDSMSRMTPDMMDQARKLAMGGQGDQIMREMQKRGIDPKAMREQMKEQQRALRGLGGKHGDATTQVILITTSRQAKVRKIPRGNITAAVGSILKCPSPVELSCSRLAQGPLSGKTIKVWYDPEHAGKNRRASKIVGFSIGGEIVVVVDDEDLSEANFTAAEKKLT